VFLRANAGRCAKESVVLRQLWAVFFYCPGLRAENGAYPNGVQTGGGGQTCQDLSGAGACHGFANWGKGVGALRGLLDVGFEPQVHRIGPLTTIAQQSFTA